MTLLAANRDLLLAFRAGHRRALTTVYRHYRPALEVTIARHLWRHEGGAGRVVEPADVVQEVFARAFAPERRRSYDGQRPYGAFLRAIAVHAAVDVYRASGRELAADSAELERALAEAAPPLDEPVCHLATLAVVHRAVQRLPRELRAVHDTRYVVGLSQRRAADTLGVGRQVLRTLESRLHLEVKQALGRTG
jgi:RNA polymerase sigma factor (sigma-70 family)